MAAGPPQLRQPIAVAGANVWISRFLPSEAHHASSRGWLMARLAAGETLAAPNLLLVEVATAIARRTNDNALAIHITESMEQEPQLQIIEIDQALTARAYQVGITMRLRAADAVYAAVAQLLNIPLYSWDSELINRGGAL